MAWLVLFDSLGRAVSFVLFIFSVSQPAASIRSNRLNCGLICSSFSSNLSDLGAHLSSGIPVNFCESVLGVHPECTNCVWKITLWISSTQAVLTFTVRPAQEMNPLTPNSVMAPHWTTWRKQDHRSQRWKAGHVISGLGGKSYWTSATKV